MRVNTNKTKLLVINPTLTKQVVPCVAAYPGNPLLCVGEVRLLGILFDERRVWWPHINDIVGRATRKIWMLLRLREVGANHEFLLINYYAHIRSVLEYGAQVWGAVINGLQSKAIENCQMKALQVILGAQSSSYSVNRAKLSVELLSDRREELMTKFAISTFKDPRFRKWYTSSPPSSLVFRDKGHPKPPRLWVPLARNQITDLRPISKYTNLLNSLTDQEWDNLCIPSPSTCCSVPNIQLSSI